MSIYTDTKLLLHGDGVDGSTNIYDSSLYGNTVTLYDGISLSTSWSKFGNSSIFFDGVNDYISVQSPIKGDKWYIGLFIRMLNVNDRRIFSVNGNALSIYLYPYDTLVVFNGTAVITGDKLSINTDYYIGLMYKNNTLYYYLNGSLVGSASGLPDLDLTSYQLLLGKVLSTQYYHGYIDEFQIITGDSVSQIDPTIVPTYPFSYNRYMPYKDLMESCIAYWDFRDGSLYDIISNRPATWTTNRWTTDHLSQLNSAVDIDSTSEQITWTNLGTVGDSLMLCRQSGSWFYAWNEPVLTTIGINTGVTKSTLEVSIVMFFNRILTTVERTQIETMLNIRYIYPTQKAAIQE